MELKTTFDCGDKGWILEGGRLKERTVGQIRVIHTDSPGTVDGGSFDNYKPQVGYLEEVMCVETGIGSGTVYTVNKHIFRERAEAATFFADVLAERERAKRALRIRNLRAGADRVSYLEGCLADARAAAAELDSLEGTSDAEETPHGG